MLISSQVKVSVICYFTRRSPFVLLGHRSLPHSNRHLHPYYEPDSSTTRIRMSHIRSLFSTCNGGFEEGETSRDIEGWDAVVLFVRS